MCDGTLLPHCEHLLSCGACQRCDALRVRKRIFEVLRFGTPIRADQESRKSGKGNGRSAIRGARSDGSGVSAVMMGNPAWPGPTEPR